MKIFKYYFLTEKFNSNKIIINGVMLISTLNWIINKLTSINKPITIN